MQGKPKVEKTWREWEAEKIGGISITIPSGFEMGDPMMNLYVYTKAEFLERRLDSRTEGVVSPLRKEK